jgi:hypothetical protein
MAAARRDRDETTKRAVLENMVSECVLGEWDGSSRLRLELEKQDELPQAFIDLRLGLGIYSRPVLELSFAVERTIHCDDSRS